MVTPVRQVTSCSVKPRQTMPGMDHCHHGQQGTDKNGHRQVMLLWYVVLAYLLIWRESERRSFVVTLEP